MSRYVYRNGKVIPIEDAGEETRPWVTGVISDHMEPAKHHGTGRIHDSKANFRADTKAIGCVEVGTEPIKARPPVKLDKGKRREDIRKAVYQLRNGIRPQFASDN